MDALYKSLSLDQTVGELSLAAGEVSSYISVSQIFTFYGLLSIYFIGSLVRRFLLFPLDGGLLFLMLFHL